MAKKGLCPACEQHRWLGGKGGLCKPCAYLTGECCHCATHRKLYVNGLCYLCYQDHQVRGQILQLQRELKAVSAYNQQLFTLYVTYLQRYRLQYFHLHQAQKLKALMEKLPWPQFKTWMDIYQWQEKHPLPHKSDRSAGDATFKIGYMLQELDLLPPRQEEQGRCKRALLTQFTEKERSWIKPFVAMLERTRRSPCTVLRYLKYLSNFNIWLKTLYPSHHFLLVDHYIIRRYLDTIYQQKVQALNLKPLRDAFNCLNAFYRWMQSENLTLTNPCVGIKLRREAARLQVCSSEQLQRLQKFIRSPHSDSEQAFLLALLLFYGLTNQDLRFAQLEVAHDKLRIILRQKDLFKGSRYYNRKPLLILPSKPHWFFNLQKKFYLTWLCHYNKVKKNHPNQWLLLPYHCHYNRPMGRDSVAWRVQKATKAATGIVISSRVLRQTCGHLYSRNQDSSVLTTLGWSSAYAFNYTWLPRELHPDTPPSDVQE